MQAGHQAQKRSNIEDHHLKGNCGSLRWRSSIFAAYSILPELSWAVAFQRVLHQFCSEMRVLQNPKQVLVQIEVVFLRRFNQTVDHSACLCTTDHIGI